MTILKSIKTVTDYLGDDLYAQILKRIEKKFGRIMNHYILNSLDCFTVTTVGA